MSSDSWNKIVEEAPYHPGYESVGFDSFEEVIGSKKNTPGPLGSNGGTQPIGRKFDGGKLEYGLLPPLALEETVKVLTFGAQKYEPDNWQFVPDSKRRYFDALQRHVWAWKQGEKDDKESGLPHLAHAMCCLMFLYEHDVKYSKYDGEDIAKVMVDEYNRNKLNNGEVK
jgi:hypothetical protein